ncbi:hypothetical protein V6N13_049790 [Hibiscus sabdariffa]
MLRSQLWLLPESGNVSVSNAAGSMSYRSLIRRKGAAGVLEELGRIICRSYLPYSNGGSNNNRFGKLALSLNLRHSTLLFAVVMRNFERARNAIRAVSINSFLG